ncbi:class I SAM-dependent methyltransferase [Roseivivax sediminis]|uniref:Methyltransferase domain-containing protein n=1 Tax=Roseivivax sediminis TaxID=936889 RepID=A0A1I2DRW9_9RHOB|nr:class I SAM-dependent methyltransferase [Roseivivax sediminis]SFE83011.1 Methyltransferase domain-containing protein [Roseivivax sediminis]
MVTVTEHYDAYPYPERDPADEARRLITGSPSHPLEMDDALWAGARDWSRPLRALVAGGGTGDGLIQLAQILKSAERTAEITYLDLSPRAREIAEARAEARGLDTITFRTGSLLDAPEYGTFDYIDCCGVLHHLSEPAEGFRALRAALSPGGGLGFMVYAPLGRSGVYPLQEAFGTLFDGLAPDARLGAARELFEAVPEGHPFRSNPGLVDHRASEAGFYDLLLHGQDRPFSVPELLEMLDETGWRLARFAMPGLYDLSTLTGHGADLPEADRMALAEKLRGTIKTHIAYAVPEGAAHHAPSHRDTGLVPHLRGVKPDAAARAVSSGKPLPLRLGSESRALTLPARAAPLLARIDGRRSMREIAGAAGLDPIVAAGLWAKIEATLGPWGLFLYSGLLRR